MKASTLVKAACAGVALILLGYFGFTDTVTEGESSLITRFGAPRAVHNRAGLYFRLPWPFEEALHFDTRKNYLDSGFLETLTGDKKNIVLQTWLTWQITDPQKFYVAVGDEDQAQTLLSDLATDAKNTVLGRYPLKALLSLNAADLKIDEIEKDLAKLIEPRAQRTYGITVSEVKIKRLGFPGANLQAVLDQMAADRNTQVVQLNAQGARDAAAIRGKADVQAAQIRADAQKQASEVRAENEKEVAAIYAEAYAKNPDLYGFLTKLRVLEQTVGSDTVLVLPAGTEPFDALKGPAKP